MTLHAPLILDIAGLALAVFQLFDALSPPSRSRAIDDATKCRAAWRKQQRMLGKFLERDRFVRRQFVFRRCDQQHVFCKQSLDMEFRVFEGEVNDCGIDAAVLQARNE